MAEQKIDDTKLPAARRGARPFAGPAGTAPAASPFLRPMVPGTRATQAPFAPAIGARTALGTAPPAARVVPEPATPIAADQAPLIAPVIQVETPTAVSVMTERGEASLTEMNEGVSATESPLPSEPEPRRRSVTSEMVAVDALDAFETVWSSIDAVDGPTTPTVGTSPRDESSLGAAAEGEVVWVHEVGATAHLDLPYVDEMHVGTEMHVDEIRRQTTNVEEARLDSTSSEDPTIEGAAPMPAWMQDDGTPAAADALWTDVSTIPSADEVLASDASMDATGDSLMDPVMASLAMAETDVEPWHEPLPAEYVPDVAALEMAWEVDAPTQPVATAESERSAVAVAEPSAAISSALRVSATLDRLAERVRGGEIDVSSVAPEATDAAVLASVLAALLGGSSRR
jgi:hypothetical protein